MNIITRSRKAFRAFVGADESGTRTSVHSFPLDSDKELPVHDRHTLVKKQRMISNSFGLFRRLFEGTSRNAIAAGLFPSANTTDPVYNRNADAAFAAIAESKNFDVRGKHDFYSSQPVVGKDTMQDGEVFALKVRGAGNTPQIQLLKTQHVGSLSGDKIYDDGIQYSPSERPLAYNVLTKNSTGQWAGNPYDAIHMLHVMDHSNRIGLKRGLPWVYHGVNSGIDIIDTVALEKVAFKLNSYFAGVITTPSGDNPKGMTARIPSGSTPSNDAQGRSRSWKNFFGGAAIPVLKEGEKFELLGHNRPSATFAEFIEFLIRDISLGFGLPPEITWSIIKVGGAPSRFVLEDADWFFEHVQRMMIAEYCGPIWEWVIADAIQKGTLRVGSDPNWGAVRWQGPRKMSMDKAKDGNLFINLKKNGMLSWDQYWSGLGKDSVKMRRAIIDEIAEDMAYCALKKVPYGVYIQSAPGTPGVDVPMLTTSTDASGAPLPEPVPVA